MIKQYLEFDDKGITQVKCMKCLVVVAERQDIGGVLRLVHQSHSTRYAVILADNTFAEMIVCVDCLAKITDADHQDLEDTTKWGWQRELTWKFKESSRPADKAAYEQFRTAFNIKKDEADIPERVLNKMFSGKRIMRNRSRR